MVLQKRTGLHEVPSVSEYDTQSMVMGSIAEHLDLDPTRHIRVTEPTPWALLADCGMFKANGRCRKESQNTLKNWAPAAGK